MNIVIFSPGFAADETDTTCIPGLQDLVQAYQRLYPRMSIHIIALHYPFREGEYCWNGANVYAAGGRNSRLLKPRTWLRVLRKIRTLCADMQIHLLHSFWLSESALLGQIASRYYGIPHIATIMGQDAKPDNKYLSLLGALAGTSLTVFALSEFAANIYQQSTGRTVQGVIPFGVVPRGIAPALRGIETNELAKTRNIDILGVGSVIPLKNYSTFLDIVAYAKQYQNDIRAVIVGGFVDSKELERLRLAIRQLDLENNILLAGEVPRSEVFSLMAQTKTLLHTSLYEGQGWVLMEALYYGACVVCFDVGYTIAHPQMHVCQNTTEMKQAIQSILRGTKQTDTEQVSVFVPVPSIDDTAQAYIQWYWQQTCLSKSMK